jgi:beta-galactosidase
MFPDRTPSPGAFEYKKVIEPVRITAEADGTGTLTIRNLHEFRDLSHLTFTWRLEEEGAAVASGVLKVPGIPAGAAATIPFPAGLPRVERESWLTLRAVLREAQPWAPAGHEVATGQVRLTAAAGSGRADRTGEPVQASLASAPGRLSFGSAIFSAHDGQLIELAGMPVDGPRLDVWRAPIDNDRGHHGIALEPTWRQLGLDRMRHRVESVDALDSELTVVTRVAAAASPLGLRATYHWTMTDEALRLDLSVIPEGDWPTVLPRLGLRMLLPESIASVEWFGLGPGEAYADSRLAALVGRYSASIEELQTPYVFPQENGNRMDVRWARLTSVAGAGIRIDGSPTFDLTVRRWSTEDLDRAKHPSDLVAGDRVWVNLDARQNGLGSASCGPGVLPQYEAHAEPTEFSVTFRTVRA